MAERFKAAVLKTVGRDERPGGSNPPLSASSFNSPSQPNSSPPYSRLIPTRSWWGEGDSNPQGCVALKTGAARLFSEARLAPRANRINFRTCENLDIPLSPPVLSTPTTTKYSPRSQGTTQPGSNPSGRLLDHARCDRQTCEVLERTAQAGYSADLSRHLPHYLDEKFKYVRFEICVAPNMAVISLQRVLFELSWPLRPTF